MHVHALRLTPRTDLKQALAAFVRQHDIPAAGIITCIGSLSQARLRMPSPVGAPEAFRTFDAPTEILSLAGTLGPDGLHLHIVLEREDGSCVGGHVVEGCLIATTAEVLIGELPDLTFHRRLDPATGYAELEVERRPRRNGPKGD